MLYNHKALHFHSCHNVLARQTERLQHLMPQIGIITTIVIINPKSLSALIGLHKNLKNDYIIIIVIHFSNFLTRSHVTFFSLLNKTKEIVTWHKQTSSSPITEDNLRQL